MAIFRELPVLEGPHTHASEGSRADRPVARPLSPSKAREILNSRKPEWLKIRPPAGENYTQIKGMLRDWEKKYPGRVESTFNALADVRPSHLMDRKLFDFTELAATGQIPLDGDKAFDREDEFSLVAKPK